VFFHDNLQKGEKVPLQPAAERLRDIAQVEEKGNKNITKEDKDLEFAVKEFDELKGVSQGKSDKELREETDASKKGKSTEKRSVAKYFAWFFFLLIAVLLLGGTYLWIFPQSRQLFLQYLSPCCPVIERICGWKVTSREPILDLIKIQDVRQRFITNWLIGNVRVFEGTAVNVAVHPLTRIQIRGKLYDAENRVLAEQISFGGNLLTDAELATLTEEDIQHRLTLPQGSNVSNDRIIPDGRLPFMIVFVHDPPGVVKATVMPAGAEKLLE
jgi:hypothetical protein